MTSKHTDERLTWTVEETARRLGISRGSAYEAVRTGQLPHLVIGRRVVIPRQALLARLAGAASQTSPSEGGR